MGYQIIQGDCKDILPTITAEACVSDPPYGCNNDCDYTRFTKGKHQNGRKTFDPIEGDDAPFDPGSLLRFPLVALFGFQFFADKLPIGSLLVWQKKPESKLGRFL